MKILLPLLIVSLIGAKSALAVDVDYYTTIAREALDSSDFKTASEKCFAVLQQDPDNADCKEITQKARVAKQKAAKDAAQKKMAQQQQMKEAAEQDKLQAQAAEAKRKKALDAPEYNVKKACQCQAAETFLQSAIVNEQKVGAIGGVVDKVKLYQLSNTLVMTQKADAYYQQKAGSSFNETQCKSGKNAQAEVAGCLDGAPYEVLQ